MDLGGKVSLLDYLVLFLILSVSVLIGFYHGYKTQIRSFCSRIFKRKQSEKENELELNEDLEETRTENRVSDYLTGNASMGVLPISFSLLASFFSTNTVLGTPAEIYQYGIQNWIIGFGFAMPPIFGKKNRNYLYIVTSDKKHNDLSKKILNAIADPHFFSNKNPTSKNC
jgi:hypothetical protein